MSVKHVANTAVLAVALCFVLSACDQHLYEGPVAIRLVGDQVEVAVCTTESITRIFVETRVDDEWQRILDAEGAAQVAPEEQFHFDDLPGSLAPTAAIEWSPDWVEFDIVMIGDSTIRGSFSGLESNPPATDRWLHPTGDYSDEPCPEV